MAFAGAVGPLHALRRLLGVAAFVLAVALFAQAAPARAHVTTDDPTSEQPAVPAETASPADEDLHPDWNDDGRHNGDRDGQHDHWPGPQDRPTAPPPPGQVLPTAPAWNPPGVLEPQQPQVPELPPVTTAMVAGTVARLRTDGRAAIPRGAPKRVRALISQYNRIVGKRYKWGGGHGTLVDSGYDCSGAVSYGLVSTGMLRGTMVSGSFARWAASGAGRWVTIYANKGHVYIEVAGLRLDTSSVGDHRGGSGVRWRPAIGQRRGFKARHPIGL